MLPEESRSKRARVLRTRWRELPWMGRQIGSPSMRTRTAALCEKTNFGGSFLIGTARAFCSAPTMARAAWNRSSDIVEGPFARIAWKVFWYWAAFAGTEGKVAFRTVMSLKSTLRSSRCTWVTAVISITPKTGSLAPAGSTDAAWASKR
jgi:hypothetical protein